MTGINNLNGLFNKTILDYNKSKKKEGWIKRQIKELMNREGYETIEGENETIFKREGNTIRIEWRYGE